MMLRTYTKDLDVWIHNSPQNSIRVVRALKKFGAPLDHDGITAETFAEKQVVYQIGIAPVRIDILIENVGSVKPWSAAFGTFNSGLAGKPGAGYFGAVVANPFQ
jgi:hypothetical protein